MALFKSDPRMGKIVIAALLCLIQLAAFSHQLIEAIDQDPPIYVIQQDKAAAKSGQWNNQRLALRNNQQVGNNMRRGKQFLYYDEHIGELYPFSASGRLSKPSQRRNQQAVVKGSTKTGRKSGYPSGVERRRFEYPDEENVRSSSRGNKSKPKKNLVCYYGSWAVYRPEGGKFPVENIDPFLCTHIIYGFVGLSYDNSVKPLDPWNDLEDNYGKGAMKRFTGLKSQNPELKALVAIGGWNEGSIKYSRMASDPSARAQFVSSAVEFLKKYNFDGLDLDWEYPAARGGASHDKQNFISLLRELREAFDKEGYLLTAAVSPGKDFIDAAYDIRKVSQYLDLINLMAYDYHGGWETKTGLNAPLFSSPVHDLTAKDRMLNVNWTVNYWLQNGANPEKIMLGVGSYGRSWTLDKSQENGINAPASQKGQAGPYTREGGSLGYNEICQFFQSQPGAWTIERDPDYLAPYAYNDRQWVGYDDVESLTLKAQFAKSMGLGGMMMWSIETDDFSGRCHDGQKYPLLRSIRSVMDSSGGPGGQAEGRPSRRPDQPAASSTRRPARPSSTSTSARPKPSTGEQEQEESGGSSSRRPTPTSSTSRRPTRPPSGSSARPSSSTSTSTRAPTEPATGADICRSDGMFADPRNCLKFIRCVGTQIYRFDCAPGTAFNEQGGYCDHIFNVPSCNRAGSFY